MKYQLPLSNHHMPLANLLHVVCIVMSKLRLQDAYDVKYLKYFQIHSEF